MEKTEEHFFDQLQAFKALVDNIPGPVYYKDKNGAFLGYNIAFQNFFCLQNGDYIGKTVFDLPVGIEEATSHNHVDIDLIKSPGSRVYKSSVTYPDGSVRYTITKKATFLRADGTVGGIVGIITDITELKSAEEALRESEARFKDLSEASMEAVFFVENGVVTNANRMMRDLFGYSDSDALGKNINDFITAETQGDIPKKKSSQNERKYETMGLKRDGTYFPIEVYTKELNRRGRPVGLYVARDITEQRGMEEEVLKAKNLQSLSTLAGGIAHDFNNLLMAIVGNISLAKMSASGDPKITEFLSEAERIAFMGKNLTHQLLTFSRGGDPIRRILYIGDIIMDLTERIIGNSLVRPKYEIATPLFPVEVDEDQIRQVLQNLVMNAKEAMPSGGTVVITCENVNVTPQDRLPLIKEDYVRISVRDEGAGISDEMMTKIFDPYFTTKGMGSQKGVGLGLAICYSIVKKHNGYILVESIPGKGTNFQVYLPAYKQEIAEVSSEAPSARQGKGRVLVMDDEEMILKIARELLQYLGYEVIVAESGEDAISFYRQAMELKRPFHAVILDLAIPGGLGGKEVMQELLTIDHQVKAIISSGYLNDPIIQDYRRYGFSGILTKPYDAKELDRTLQEIIKRTSNTI